MAWCLVAASVRPLLVIISNVFGLPRHRIGLDVIVQLTDGKRRALPAVSLVRARSFQFAHRIMYKFYYRAFVVPILALYILLRSKREKYESHCFVTLFMVIFTNSPGNGYSVFLYTFNQPP
jgi:hypothetical protein